MTILLFYKSLILLRKLLINIKEIQLLAHNIMPSDQKKYSLQEKKEKLNYFYER
jgi:hypothetical protein